MQSYGFTCTQLSYLPSFAPMVECVYDESGFGNEYLMTAPAFNDEIRYDANETVILSAHFDSRGVRPCSRSSDCFVDRTQADVVEYDCAQSFGYTTAPGADDDASGTALVLAVARQIYEHRLRFARKLGASREVSRAPLLHFDPSWLTPHNARAPSLAHRTSPVPLLGRRARPPLVVLLRAAPRRRRRGRERRAHAPGRHGRVPQAGRADAARAAGPDRAGRGGGSGGQSQQRVHARARRRVRLSFMLSSRRLGLLRRDGRRVVGRARS